MRKYKVLIFVAIFFSATLSAFSQCFPLSGTSPAFEFTIPSGVTVTSVIVRINNYSHGGSHYSARIRSFQDLETVRVESDGDYEVLSGSISGPSTQDLQIESGLYDFCGYVGDSVSFDWQVIISATGVGGTTINYSGPLTDNLAIPDYLGKVFNGTNIVTGSIDNKLAGPGIVVYPDNDFDGFGDASADPVLACSDHCPYSSSTNNLDCDDHDRNVNPDQEEIPYNGLDDDCDATTLDDDLDGDGFIAAQDCDDPDPDVNARQQEIPYNGVDDDCDATTLDDDLDGDGFIAAQDCDDNDLNINPDQQEIPYNGLDDDCDAATLDDDLDGDGFIAAQDCDDTDPDVNANQQEIPYNGLDDDCDATTLDDDLDGDGFIAAQDCDDNDPNVNPNQIDVPNNSIDEDCDGSDSVITSVEESFSELVKIYPNPTSRYIYIDSKHLSINLIELYDTAGNKILSFYAKDRIDLEGINDGIYLLKIKGTTENQTIVRRITLHK